MPNLTLFLLPLLFSIIFFISGRAEAVFSTRSRRWTTSIPTLCKNTSYPALCIQYLSIFPNSTTRNPKNLAKAALLASLYRAQYTRLHILKVSSKLKAIKDHQVAEDCLEVLGDGVDSLCKSIIELSQLRGREKAENCDVPCHVSNIQTFLSAAVTDASSCVDEFDELPRRKKMGKLMATVKAKALNVEQATSVALDLFCQYVANCE